MLSILLWQAEAAVVQMSTAQAQAVALVGICQAQLQQVLLVIPSQLAQVAQEVQRLARQVREDCKVQTAYLVPSHQLVAAAVHPLDPAAYLVQVAQAAAVVSLTIL
jgi:hypothetical protein